MSTRTKRLSAMNAKAARPPASPAYIAYINGIPLLGTIADTPQSTWAKIKSHPTQTAKHLRSLGYEVRRIVIHAHEADDATP
jgi:hypothetical protein